MQKKLNLITKENIDEILSQLPAANDSKINEGTVIETPIGKLAKLKINRGQTQFFCWCLLPNAPLALDWAKPEGKLIL